jgi:FAD:protein FMN transferase
VSDSLVHSTGAMGTVVTIQIVGHGDSPAERADRQAAAERAVEWFRVVELTCTRFDEMSELRQLCTHVGEPVVVSEFLFQAVSFAVRVAEESDGAFDPTVVETHGHRSTYRDLNLDPVHRTLELRRPLMIDLGAVAKGLAVDAASRELQSYRNFVVDAGGDLYLSGCNPAGEPWSIGMRHPRDSSAIIETLRLSDAAVCTSGDYDPKSRTPNGGHHILDPRGETSPAPSATTLASVTVIAPSAMVADALGTAAFVLGPRAGISFLERNGVRGILYTPDLERFETRA